MAHPEKEEEENGRNYAFLFPEHNKIISYVHLLSAIDCNSAVKHSYLVSVQ